MRLFYSLTGNVFAPLAALVTAPILAHYLTLEGRGTVAGATALFAVLLTITSFGLPEATTYFVASRAGARSGAARNRAVGVALPLGLLGTVPVWVLAPALSGGSHELTDAMRVATLFLPLCLVTGIMRADAAGRHRWGLIAAERLSAAITRLGLTTGLAITGGLTPLIAASIVALSPGVGLVLYLGYATRDWRKNRTADANTSEPAPSLSVGELLTYGGLIWVGTGSAVVLSRVDQVLFPSLSSLSELAVYAVAVNVGELASVIVLAVRDVAFASEASEPNAIRTAALARVAFIASLTTCLPLICSLPLWIGPVFGSEYLASIWPATLILAGSALNAPGSIAGAALTARGRPGVRSAIIVTTMIVNLIPTVILISAHGALGAAIATVIGSFTASWLSVGLLSRQLGCRATDFYGVKLADLALARRILASAWQRRTSG